MQSFISYYCPYCGMDPYQWADTGQRLEAIAVVCCERQIKEVAIHLLDPDEFLKPCLECKDGFIYDSDGDDILGKCIFCDGTGKL